MDTAQHDIDENKNRHTSIHFLETAVIKKLSKALNLISVIKWKTRLSALTAPLTPLLKEVTDNVAVTDLTLDELKLRAGGQMKDTSNASVIIASLENALSLKNRQAPAGMTNSVGLFTPVQKKIGEVNQQKVIEEKRMKVFPIYNDI